MPNLTRRTKNFGWGYSTTPSGEDAYSIEPPSAPMYTGTPNQVLENRKNDRTFNSLGGAFYAERYFLGGVPIRLQRFDIIDLLDRVVSKIEYEKLNG